MIAGSRPASWPRSAVPVFSGPTAAGVPGDGPTLRPPTLPSTRAGLGTERGRQFAVEVSVVVAPDDRWLMVKFAEPVVGTADGDGGDPGEYVEAVRVGHRRESPYLDEDGPGHRYGVRRAAEARADLGKDGADEPAVETAEGGLVPVGDPPDKITQGFGGGQEITRWDGHPTLRWCACGQDTARDWGGCAAPSHYATK